VLPRRYRQQPSHKARTDQTIVDPSSKKVTDTPTPIPAYTLTMTSAKLFESIPPFPDDVPTTSLYTISLASLQSGETTACKITLDACQKLGFFLLDLRGSSLGDAVTCALNHLFSISEKLMNSPEDIKKEYEHDPPRHFLGYVSALSPIRMLH